MYRFGWLISCRDEMQINGLGAVNTQGNAAILRVEIHEFETAFAFADAQRIALRRLAGISPGDECPFGNGEVRDTSQQKVWRRPWRYWLWDYRRRRQILEAENIPCHDAAVRIAAWFREHIRPEQHYQESTRSNGMKCPGRNATDSHTYVRTPRK